MKVDNINNSLNEEQLLRQLASSSINKKRIREASEQGDYRSNEKVRITSAQQLTDEERKTVIDAVSHVIPFDNDKVDFRVDPSMIAGIRVQSTTYFYDNSLKRKLNDLNGYLHKQINMK